MHDTVGALRGNCVIPSDEDSEKRRGRHSKTTRSVAGHNNQDAGRIARHQAWSHQMQDCDKIGRE